MIACNHANYTYNALNKIIGFDYSDDTTDITFAYTRLGLPSSITDAAGTRNFEYNAQFALTKELINGIYTKEFTRTYTTSGLKGKNAGMSIDGTNLYTYGYDTYGQLNKITTASGDFTYSHVANGNVSTFECVNNALDNRTSMKRSGSSFATPDTLNYTCDSRSEMIRAVSTAIPAYNFNYAYDQIGNRLTSTKRGKFSPTPATR